jgi:putative tricarboxylic transport membrane protein
MGNVLAGFITVFQPLNSLLIFVGMLTGLAVGILPGIGGPMVIALFIPLTFSLNPTSAILLMVVLYVTAVYGGSITAILFKIPGEGPAIVTTFDGYELTKKGQAGLALSTALFSSCLGGLFGTIVLIFLAPWLSSVALNFGDPEYFAMALLGLSVASGIGGGSTLKNILSALTGLFLATWGLDPIAGEHRFTFGSAKLLMGITFVPAAIGLFALGEVIETVETSLRSESDPEQAQTKVKIGLPPFLETWRMKFLYLRSAIIGTFVGILPGVGAVTASFFGYSEAVRWSKYPEKFGTGIVDGVAAPETANNAACAGAMVPLLTMGIPGSANTAVMIGAFMIHGIRPGPLLIYQQAEMMNAIFAAMLLSNLLLILAAIIGIKLLVKILEVSYSKVGPAIVLFSIIGSYAIRNSVVDVWVMFGFGIMSYFMRKYRFGLAPMILGMILGPLLETSLHRGMIIADYNFYNFLARPITAPLLAVAVLSFIYPLLKGKISKEGGITRPGLK